MGKKKQGSRTEGRRYQGKKKECAKNRGEIVGENEGALSRQKKRRGGKRSRNGKNFFVGEKCTLFITTVAGEEWGVQKRRRPEVKREVHDAR